MQVIKNTKEGESSLISIPTAGGKTVIFANVATTIEGRTLIVVPSSELRLQTIDKLLQQDSTLDIGSVQASLDSVNNKVVVATRQSLSSAKSDRIERMLSYGEFEIIVIDEVHNATSQIGRILSKLNKNIKCIGVTATPYNQDLKKIFKEITYSKTILSMIQDKYLCEPRAIQIKTNVDLSGVKVIAGEFNQSMLEDAVNISERNDLVVEAYKKYAMDRKATIVFCSGIEHSNNLADEFNKSGIECLSIDSTLDKGDRSDVIDRFISGKVKVITNVGILVLGFDYTSVDCVLLASPTKSKTKYTQQIGRGLRLSEGKEDCLIIDMQDNCSSHNLMDLSNIFDMTIKDGENVTEAIERNEKEKVDEEERQRLRKELEEQQQKEYAELIAKQIELFNTNIGNSFMEESYLDWFKCNKDTYALSESLFSHYIIQQETRDNFKAYHYRAIPQTREYTLELLNSNDNLMELINYIENEEIKQNNSFTYKKSRWKMERATDAQLKWARNCRTKMDVHIYSNAYKFVKAIDKFIDENESD